MATVNLSSEFGLVVRRAALEQRGVSYRKLLDTMETEAPLDVNEELISFGPHFGLEAATEFARRLESIGLINIDDFFVFAGDFPEWCGFTGYFNKRDTPSTG
ncbi:hypothetical protein [Hyalangium versicolor]|uniref:hypothetical protein n=1 Tax=Hyalangium versicolor TaxID=2861190 RepID=UPI001CCD447F|nr:hypothetical protein [Hyalangium versicolor]